MLGHAIEARVNAEDARLLPVRRPGAGSRSTRAACASTPRSRPASVVGTDYDSMIAKVIAYGPDRATALARLDRALADTAILGLTTNTGFLRTLLAREDVRAGEMDTGLIGRLDPPAAAADRRGGRARRGRAGAGGGGRARRRRSVRAPRRLAARRRRARRPTGSSRSTAASRSTCVLERVRAGLDAVACGSSATLGRRHARGWLGYEGWTWHVTEATAEDVAPRARRRRAAGADARVSAARARSRSATPSRRGRRSWCSSR